MLKKAGIVVACATAGMLAVAPLAFADDDDDPSTPNVLSGNAVGVNLQDVICNTNALNDLGIVSLLNAHKNEYNQTKSCNPKNRTVAR